MAFVSLQMTLPDFARALPLSWTQVLFQTGLWYYIEDHCAADIKGCVMRHRAFTEVRIAVIVGCAILIILLAILHKAAQAAGIYSDSLTVCRDGFMWTSVDALDAGRHDLVQVISSNPA